MFVPEYTITGIVLKNVSLIEYNKAVIENTVIMPNWEKQLQAQNLIEEAFGNLQMEGRFYSQDIIKKVSTNMVQNPPQDVVNVLKVIGTIQSLGRINELNENDLKDLHRTLGSGVLTESKLGNYRSNKILGKTEPEEILAEIVELFDWLNSLDAKDSHPIVTAGIFKARLEAIQPFESFNTTINNLMSTSILQTFNYSFKNFASISFYYQNGFREYKNIVDGLNHNSNDFTQWIEYFSQAYAIQSAKTQEKVKLLARDTKVSKVTSSTKLTDRQEKIVEFLQDYGVLQNKDFHRLFPEKSEDSILRDLKTLTQKGFIKKSGSTKSSVYELV